VIRTVDLVIAGSGSGARSAAVDALERGQHVLLVLRSADASAARRCRRLWRTANVDATRVIVLTNAEVTCIDGVGRVEAVVIRSLSTGRLRAVNASAFLRCDDEERC